MEWLELGAVAASLLACSIGVVGPPSWWERFYPYFDGMPIWGMAGLSYIWCLLFCYEQAHGDWDGENIPGPTTSLALRSGWWFGRVVPMVISGMQRQAFTYLYIHVGAIPSLPVDSSLGSMSSSCLPSLSTGASLGLLDNLGEKSSAVVVAEGIPPVPVKLLEKIRRWEFIDLALLVGEERRKTEDIPMVQDGRVVLFQLVEQAQRQRRQITDINTWS